MRNDKLTTYFGFCIKANKIIFGLENLEKKRGVDLLVVDESLSPKSMENAKRLKEKFACPMLVFGEEKLGEILLRPKVKMAGIKDKNLAIC